MTNSKTVVMTGATSGFGQVIAKHLIQKNYNLTFLARSDEKAKRLIETLRVEHPEALIDYLICDLSSFQSITKVSTLIMEKQFQIDLLILNAGLWNFEFRETEDKIEETFQVNVLSPALLFFNLQQLMKEDSKVILTASGLHQGTLNYEDLEFRMKFSGFKSYRQSKLAVILMTRLFASKPEFKDISFYAVHPGMVRTELGKNAGWLSRTIFHLMGKSLKNGAKTHLHLIDTPSNQLTNGGYYANSKLTKSSKESNDLNEAENLLKIIQEHISPHLTK